MHSSQYWIDKLFLQPHPEGGFYRETYRSDLTIRQDALPNRFTASRTVSTAIYFLLQAEDFSAFHRLGSDEMWHFYAGGTLIVHVIDAAGTASEIVLGSNLEAGEVPQAVVRAGCWFGSRVKDPEAFALVGCTVAPGFEFDDFELGKRPDLVRKFPQHRALIERLTRD